MAKTPQNTLANILSGKAKSFTAVQYAEGFTQVNGALDGLQYCMAEQIKDFDAKALKAFRSDFYVAVKAAAAAAGMDVAKKYGAAKTMFSRTLDLAHPERVKAATTKTKGADQNKSAKSDDGKIKITPQHAVECLKFVLAHPKQFEPFCAPADVPVFSRLLGVIANNMKKAKSNKA